MQIYQQQLSAECELSPCGNPAAARIRIEGEKPKTFLICQRHLDDLADRFRGSVAMNLASYSLFPITATEAQVGVDFLLKERP